MALTNSWLPIAIITLALVAVNESIIQERTQGRIFGGQNADEGQFPYQVLVTRVVDGFMGVCGGSILSRNYVVTAAQCVTGYPASNYWIRAGTVKFNSGGVEIQVAEVKIHPQYTYNSYNYDVALLRLSSPLNYSDKIKPILLASVELPEGTPTIISGWGAVQSGELPNQLQYNTAYTLNHTSCMRLNIPQLISESIRCIAKSAGNGICDGDAGGPAVANGVLIGVASFLVNSCNSSLPNGFTDVIYTRDWIRANSDADCTCSA